MSAEAAKQICSWKYAPPYNVYDYMNYEEAVKKQSAILRSENENNYLCFWNNETLVAYTSIILKDDKVCVGIGIAPQFCGMGLGNVYLNQTVIEIKKKYPLKEIWVQVRSWNKRAIKCYKKCGFKESYKKTINDRFGNYEDFVFMCLEQK